MESYLLFGRITANLKHILSKHYIDRQFYFLVGVEVTIKYLKLTLVFCFVMMAQMATAERAGHMDASFSMPYFLGKDFNFDGGASVDINSDPGFGFSMAYNVSNHLATRLDFSFNNVSYSGTRVLDDGARTQDRILGSLDTFSLKIGGDYYVLPGNFTPFLHASLGWHYLDTNIASGPPGSFCWWDPWFGYICDGYQPTYTENNLVYGIGGGLRMDFRSSFVKLGYHLDYLDVDNTGSIDFETVKLEIGFTY